jgi:hypothetical protein
MEEEPPTPEEPALFLADEGLEHSVLVASRGAGESPISSASDVLPASFEEDVHLDVNR